MTSEIKKSLIPKSNEVLEGILLFLSNKEVKFEDLDKHFPNLAVNEDRGKTLGSLFSGITRTLINGKRLTISIPQFGDRRKVWKLNKDITPQELQEVELSVKDILEERK